MVSIFTYRDERKLFAVIGAIVVAATIALVQLDALKTGKPSFLAVAAQDVALYAEEATAFVAGGVRGAASATLNAPRLTQQNAALRAQNASLRGENRTLHEALAEAPEARAIERLREALGAGIAATVIGYDPEALTRAVTIDRGSDAGVRQGDGVVDAEGGVAGRVIAVGPATSTVLLVTDGASKVPAIVQRGRWWGIATGTNAAIRLQYVSQDAKLKPGDVVVTGEGRSFHAGYELGRITSIDHPEGALYQSAIVRPAVAFGRISRVLVVPR